MFREGIGFKKVYIACGYTDLRCGINKLSMMVQNQFNLNPFDEGTLYLFCGRKTDRIKGLLWEGDGFLLLYKRIEKGKYRWPRGTEEMKSMTPEQFEWLMKGLEIEPSIQKVYPKYVG